MIEGEHFHRRHLPHIYIPDAVYFITFRLAGSLPEHALEDLKEKARLQKKARFSFVDYDRALENAERNVKWLADPRIAEMVAEAIRFQDGKDYRLVAYCIMQNHVHLVIGVGECELLAGVRQVTNLSNKSLSPILHSLKRYTARRANEILGLSGTFWQDESYDHIITSGRELERVIQYVLNNPVKAGLVQHWSDWKWTYTAIDVGMPSPTGSYPVG